MFNVSCAPLTTNNNILYNSKKKNIITQNAKYENIVYMHDYIVLDNNWYKGY